MTRCLAIGMAVLCSTGLGAAQSSKNTAGKSATGQTVTPRTVVVTGCVSQATDGKGYVLNDAIMAPRPVDKKAPATGAPSGDKTVLSYLLDGGDMRSHVGQKVRISATKTTDNTMALDHKDFGGTLKVKSVKMIAPSCS
ncbi:MAG: hypothetical protein V7647_2699 [Acidobacteriota bacterium]